MMSTIQYGRWSVRRRFKRPAALVCLVGGALVASLAAAMEPPPPGQPDQPGDGPRRRWREPGRGPRQGEGPRGPGAFGQGGDEERAQLPPEVIERGMNLLRERLPRWHERLERVRQTNPERFERMFRRIMPVMREYEHLRRERPELAETIIQEFELEQQLAQLSREYRAAESPEVKAQLEGQIREAVRQQFTIRHRRHEARLEEFARRLQEQQQQLDRMRQFHQEMAGKLDQMIERRTQNVMEGKLREPPPGPGLGPPGQPGGRPGEFRGPPPGRPGDRGEGPPRRGWGHRPGPRGDHPPPPPPEEDEEEE